jgi:hypothetical protein
MVNDVPTPLGRRGLFWLPPKFFSTLAWHVEEFEACRETSKRVEILIYLLGYILIRCRIMQLQKEIVHYPTLKTILAIEEVVKKANNPVSRNQILARLQTGVMRSTLNLALDYMEKRGMVLETKKGFIWTFNPSRKLEKAEQEGLPV